VTIEVAVDAATLIALWAWGLWSPGLRTWRTGALLGFATIAYLLVRQLALSVGVPLRIVIVATTIWLLAGYTSKFIARDRPRDEFDIAYSAALDTLKGLAERRQSGQLSEDEFAVGLRTIESELAAAPKSDVRWEELRARAVAHVQRLRLMYESATRDPDSVAGALVDSRGETSALIELHDRLRRQSMSFWDR
jgi:hypothetical protein